MKRYTEGFLRLGEDEQGEYYLASEVDARIEALEFALRGLVDSIKQNERGRRGSALEIQIAEDALAARAAAGV